MRSSRLIWGVLGWVVACGDDSGSRTTEGGDADTEIEASTAEGASQGDLDGGLTFGSQSDNRTSASNDNPTRPSGESGAESETNDTAASGHGGSSGDGGGNISPGTSSELGTSASTCTNDCELDAVQCNGDGQGLDVERCMVDDATGCTVWQNVADCNAGSCVPSEVPDGCDPSNGAATCSEDGIIVCSPGPTGCPVWQAPTAAMQTDGDFDIDDGATVFNGYGVLVMQLTNEVSSAELVVCLTDARDVATETSAPEVIAIDAKGDGEYELALSGYQLPVAYEVSVAVGNPPAVRSTVLAPDAKSRVAFVSSTEGNADFSTWPTANSDDSLTAADEVCAAEAQAAGLSGSFRAFLSVEAASGIRDATDAVCRLRGGDGVVSDDCDLGEPLSELQLSAPFLDLKGLPVAYGTADIEAGHWRLPIGYTADGSVSSTGVEAWTGSTFAGQFARSDCDGWTTADDGERGNATGNPGVTTPNDTYSLACDEDHSILCFSSGEGHPLVTSHEHTGKTVFAVELPESSEVDSAVANQACEDAFGGPDVVAWFSDEDQDALCTLAGLDGKIENSCGEASPADVQGPWVRADGYVVADSLQELLAGPKAPINLGFNGVFSTPDSRLELVRTDTRVNGGRGAVSVNVPCISGDRASMANGWTYFTNSCDSVADYRPFVYCFER